MDILDSVTLRRLQTLEFPREISTRPEALIFSPDSRTLTSLTCNYYQADPGGFVVSWDLQTGGVVSAIEWTGPRDTNVGGTRITYSMDRKVVAVLFRYQSSSIISIYNVVSGVYMHDVDLRALTNQDLVSGAPYVYNIWTHGESFRFATTEPEGITIWEVGFAPGATPMEVETLSVPKKGVKTFVFKPRAQSDIARTEFHPVSCRLAFIRIGEEGTLLIWDARVSRFLLRHTDIDFWAQMSFSSDGRFFACTTVKSEVYLWEESPTGYTLCERFTPGTHYPTPRLSPNCKSIVIFGAATIQLWSTKTFTPTSGVLTRPPQKNDNFILEFLTDRLLAITTRQKDKTVTVLDLKSGVPQLTIDTSIEVYGIKPIGKTIVVLGDKKAITWNLPGGHFFPGARMNIKESTRTISFGGAKDSVTVAATISLDFRYIALLRYNATGGFLDVYCKSTRSNLRVAVSAFTLWLAPGGHNIWCAAHSQGEVFTITRDALDHTKTGVDIGDGSWGCPWGSTRGYKFTYDGWIVGADGRRLLMLPPLWRSRLKEEQVWNGKFLALLHGALPEPVILELEAHIQTM